MGTRNLTCVFYGGEYKIAQYGQWDGYPEGQGKTVLEFLKSADLEFFKHKLELLRFDNKEDKKELDDFFKSIGSSGGWMTMKQADLYHKKYPLLTRDNGAEILNLVYNLEEPAFLHNSVGFAGDSLFCEWAYVIDLDKEVLEVYSGFNKNKVTEGRFVSGDPKLEKTDNYEPITMVKSYPLNELPDLKQFYEDLKQEDE